MNSAKKQIDTLIVGQGMAGSILAWQLIESGQKVLVICDESAPSASRVAAGLFNPVTGQRLVLQEHADTIIPAARTLYRKLESQFGKPFFHEKPMFRVVNTGKEQMAYNKRKGDPAYAGFLGNPIENKQLNAPFGAFEQQQTGYLDTNALLDALRDYFVSEDSFISTRFDYSNLIVTATGVEWRGYKADQIIFCEGFMGKDNPWFHWLPFQPAKGEIIRLRTEAELPDAIINGGKWLMPVHDGSYKTGATYDHDLSNLEPTCESREELVGGMQQLLKSPIEFSIIDEKVGVRPNTLDKQPFIGFHPTQKQLGIFNGFGSKGSMLIPFYAEAFASHLTGNTPIPAAVDIARIKRPRISLTEQVHESLLSHFKPGTIAIDATAGNGHDTLFLARHVGKHGQVFAFDIQKQAIDNTRTKLKEAGFTERVTLIQSGHEHMADHIPNELHDKVDIIMFNLGYLPNADKSVISKPPTTLQALDAALDLLAPNGRISILAYPGHPGGREETEAVKAWAGNVPENQFAVTIHESENNSAQPPEWIEIIKTHCL